MDLRMLSFNCQRAYQPGLENFLRQTIETGAYDILMLQEVTQQVLGFLQHSSYDVLRAYNDEAGEESELCIAYKRSRRMVEHGYRSFSSMRNDPWRGYKHPSFGFLWATFEIRGERIRVGSIHMHSGVDQRARLRELKVAKKILLESPIPTVFAGDTNAGYPGESAGMWRALKPEFLPASKGIGPTLDSRYSEKAPHLPNRIASFFRMFNIKIPLWTDQVFADANTFKSHAIKCRVLPERVSDHNPIDITVQLRQAAPSDPSRKRMFQRA